MANPYLASLQELHGHAQRLADLAGRGDWEGLTVEAGRNPALFAGLKLHASDGLTATERHEAQQLGAAIVACYQKVEIHLAPWLKDVAILLRDLGRP